MRRRIGRYRYRIWCSLAPPCHHRPGRDHNTVILRRIWNLEDRLRKGRGGKCPTRMRIRRGRRTAYQPPRRVGRTPPLSTLDRLPTSSIQWNAEEPAQDALAAKDFKKWRAATGWNAADVCD